MIQLTRAIRFGLYARGDGFSDEQWKKFDASQQAVASRLERASAKMDAKAFEKAFGKGSATAENSAVQTGDNVLFAGFIVLGSNSQKVIIRALGPSTGVAGALADPTLELHDGNGATLESNDNWVDSPHKQAIIDSTIPPPGNAESAIVRTLSPAQYTAIVRGANNSTGIAVVEVYALE
jgi:hypothetical protein